MRARLCTMRTKLICARISASIGAICGSCTVCIGCVMVSTLDLYTKCPEFYPVSDHVPEPEINKMILTHNIMNTMIYIHLYCGVEVPMANVTRYAAFHLIRPIPHGR